jgi:hypothetical protein
MAPGYVVPSGDFSHDPLHVRAFCCAVRRWPGDVLRVDVRLLTTRPIAVGTRRLYRVNPAGVAALRDYLDRMWDNALSAFAAAVETEEEQ